MMTDELRRKHYDTRQQGMKRVNKAHLQPGFESGTSYVVTTSQYHIQLYMTRLE
jgi:hypothetical protein